MVGCFDVDVDVILRNARERLSAGRVRSKRKDVHTYIPTYTYTY